MINEIINELVSLSPQIGSILATPVNETKLTEYDLEEICPKCKLPRKEHTDSMLRACRMKPFDEVNEKVLNQESKE